MASQGQPAAPAADLVLEAVRALATRLLAPHRATVYLFGSWALGTRRGTSDIDIAVEAPVPLPPGVLADLREALEESSIPYRVDVVDLADADAALRERVHREGRRWSGSTSG